MDEKTILENVLTINKSLIMLSINGTIESSNEKITKFFKEALISLLNMQEETFKLMSEKNYYQIKNVKKDDIAKIYTKLKNDCSK